MLVTFVRSFSVSLAIVAALSMFGATYAYFTDESAHNGIVIIIAALSGSIFFISLWLYKAAEKIEKDGLENKIFYRLVRHVFLLHCTFVGWPEKHRGSFATTLYWLVLFAPPLACMVISVLLEAINVEPIATIANGIGDFWRTRFLLIFKDYELLAELYNALLIFIAIPQAIILSRYALNQNDLAELFLLPSDARQCGNHRTFQELSGAFVVVVIFGILYWKSGAARFLSDLGLLAVHVEPEGKWILFSVGALDHLIFVYFLSGWIKFRERIAISFKSARLR